MLKSNAKDSDYMKEPLSNSFYQETIFNVFPYDLPAFPLVHLTNAPFRQMHYHSVFEIGYCYHGDGECAFSDGIVPFKEGDAEFFFPYQPHISRSTNSDRSVWNFSHFDIAEVFSDSVFNKEFWEKFVALENGLYGIIHREKYPEICDCIEKIIQISRSEENNRLLKCRLLIGNLLVNIMETRAESHEIKQKFNKRINKLMPAMTYIKQHYNEQITITKLAKICFMSVSSFRENFSYEMGVSPQEYLLSTRMRYAKYYLENSNETISKICQKCGFSDTANFYKQFSKKYGMSPTSYRKNYIEDKDTSKK